MSKDSQAIPLVPEAAVQDTTALTRKPVNLGNTQPFQNRLALAFSPHPMLTLSYFPPLSGKTGGVYVPPFKLARMMAEASNDRASPEYQRLTWEALKKSLNGIINKVNITNIKAILVEVFREVRLLTI